MYRRQAGLLTLYLTASNQTKVRAFRTTSDILPVNGRFAIGQWIPSSGNISTLPNSTFNANIDEFRIWSRRSNPSLIYRNPKLNPAASYSKDLLHLFKFDNLSNHFVKDELTSIRFIYQHWYPAVPQFSSLDISFVQETVSFRNRTFEEAAMKRCRELLFEGQIYSKCEPLGFGIISRFYIDCLQETARANSIDSAVHIVVSFVSHCRYALGIEVDGLLRPFCGITLKDYFNNWSGATCNQSCIYGVWCENVPWSRNGTSGTEDRCICEDGYWGENCSRLCPGGVLNSCSSKGKCNVVNGSCTCRGNRISTYMNDTDRLPCSECLPGWKGAECNIGTKELSVSVGNKNINRGFCIAIGNTHFVTFDRTSLSIDLQGMHLLVSNEQVHIYVATKACSIHPTCRHISEVFIIGRFGESSVMLINGQLKVTTRKSSTNEVSGIKETVLSEVTPSAFTQSLSRDTTIRYGGTKKERLEIQAGDKFYVLIFLYSNQLSVIVEERIKSLYVNGICSFAMRNSSQQTLEPQARFRNGTFVDLDAGSRTVISQQLIANEFMKSYKWNNSTDVLLSNTSKFWAQGPGYMLYFAHNRISGELLSLDGVLNEWTIELWLHPGQPAENSSDMCNKAVATKFAIEQQVLSVEHQGNRYLSLSYNGFLHFQWDEYIVSSGIQVMSNIWTHISVSWRSYDGRLRIQALSPCSNAQSFTTYNIKLGQTYSFNGTLVLGQYLRNGREILENDFVGAVDELRIWMYARSANDTEKQAKKRLYFPTPGLLVACYFDEIAKSRIPTVLAAYPLPSNQPTIDDQNTFTTSEKLDLQLMPLEAPPHWLPSTVPFEIEADYTVTFRTSNLSYTANEICHKAFYTGVLNTYCSKNLPRTAAFYYQACISDIAATENTGISEHFKVAFALVCSMEIEVPTCRLRDVYDGFPFCEDAEEQPVWTETRIFLLLLGIILALVVVVAITIYIRKSKAPTIAPEDRYGGEVAPHNDERPLFERDSFIASSFQSLPRAGPANEEDVSGLVKTSEKFLDDGDILIKTSPRRPYETSKPSLFNAYEENETEF